MAASRCYFGLLRDLRSKLLSKTTKCKIYKTLIRPILTYGCESWILKKSDENLILVFERKVLRTIFGAVCEGERWRTRYNFKLQRDFNEPNIVAVVKTRLRWTGHVARMDRSRAPSMLFRNEDPGGQRRAGRPRARWADGVQDDLLTLGVTNWKTTAQDRSRWNQILEQAKTSKWL